MVGGLSALSLLDCGAEGTAADAGAGGGTATGGGGGSTATGGGGGSTTGGGGGSTTDGGSATVAWATAGTSVMTGKDYGNPFASGVGASCNVYRAATEGPCHATSALLNRSDVSEGYAGLPVRLELLIVDANCLPVPNAIVEIWMCDTFGVYSGDIDGNNDAFCTGGSSTAAAALWGRGIQTAGADGRLTFDGNFPGWYSSRATHIHFRVTVGSTTYIVSQLFFPEALKTDVYSTQPNYREPSGSGYVLNANDNVVSQAGFTLSEVECSWAKQSDGALLAWKAITLNA